MYSAAQPRLLDAVRRTAQRLLAAHPAHVWPA
jgi:hypothetical protein